MAGSPRKPSLVSNVSKSVGNIPGKGQPPLQLMHGAHVPVVEQAPASPQSPGRFARALVRSPILWGSLASAVFYGLIHGGVIESQYIRNYFIGHPVEYVTTIMFLIGLAALSITALSTFWQSRRLAAGGRLLGAVPAGGQTVSDCPMLLSRLEGLGFAHRNGLLVRRFRDALDRIICRNSAEGLEDELKYLADRDADRAYESYALFRVIIWAIPVLGFLGTVIGITLAIGGLNPTALEESIDQVVMALGIAFATTTQALSLSIVLMFTKYLVGQTENNLLARIERQTDDELLGRFEVASNQPEGQLAAVRRMAETVIQTNEQLLERQVELWQSTIDDSRQRWAQMAASAGREVQASLTGALEKSLHSHSQNLVKAEQEQAERNRHHWGQVQQSLSESAKSTTALQSSVSEQVHILHRTVEATGQVARLEETLNRNLSALAGAKNFEQTVMSLAATIHLLNARLGNDATGSNVQLDPDRRPPQAA